MTSSQQRIFLSPPHMSGQELEFVQQAFKSNYIAPLGPMVDAFEKEFSDYTGIPHCLAVSSGTAAMHLALRHLLQNTKRGMRNSKEPPLILASTLTFVGSVSPATFEDCELRFIDCDPETWNMDAELLEQELTACEKEGRLPAAVIPTDLYGQCCDLPRIVQLCKKQSVPVICDSAEAIGARYLDSHKKAQTDKAETWKHAGYDALASVYSFNGNKIITTSGGGMLASHDQALIDHARKLATQARDTAPWYEHSEIGFNYRMSNIIAAIGLGQLKVLDDRVDQKRRISEHYRQALTDLPGITFMPEPSCSRGNRWLTVILVDPLEFGSDTHTIRTALEAENIEARPIWKPMHLQPVFKAYTIRGGSVSEELFKKGLCLPSGTALSESDINRVCELIRQCMK